MKREKAPRKRKTECRIRYSIRISIRNRKTKKTRKVVNTVQNAIDRILILLSYISFSPLDLRHAFAYTFASSYVLQPFPFSLIIIITALGKVIASVFNGHDRSFYVPFFSLFELLFPSSTLYKCLLSFSYPRLARCSDPILSHYVTVLRGGGYPPAMLDLHIQSVVLVSFTPPAHNLFL